MLRGDRIRLHRRAGSGEVPRRGGRGGGESAGDGERGDEEREQRCGAGVSVEPAAVSAIALFLRNGAEGVFDVERGEGFGNKYLSRVDYRAGKLCLGWRNREIEGS